MQVGDIVKVRTKPLVGLVLQISGKAVLIEDLRTHDNELFTTDQLCVLKRKLFVEEDRREK